MFVKHYAPNCTLVPKLAVCMVHLFHSNAVKFNFLKKLFGCDCFDLDPETECKLFCRKVRNEVIFFSAPTSILNMKALAQIRFEISCTQDFQNLFSEGHYSNKGHNTYMKKIQANYFFMRNLYMKFQNPIIHRSKVSNFTEKWKNQ